MRKRRYDDPRGMVLGLLIALAVWSGIIWFILTLFRK